MTTQDGGDKVHRWPRRSADRLVSIQEIDGLPYDTEAERAVLGGIIVCGSWPVGLQGVLQATQFYHSNHREAYRALQRIRDRGEPPDIVIFNNELRDAGQLESCGGPEFSARLMEDLPPTSNIMHHAGIVAEKARRRELISQAAGIIEAASDGDAGSELKWIRRLRFEQPNSKQWEPLSLEAVESPEAAEPDDVVAGLIPRGDVTVIAAGWKVGKTLLAYRIGLDIALGRRVFGRCDVDANERVAIFQLEMPVAEDERRLRQLAIGSGADSARVPELVRERRLLVYNRPPLDLTDSVGIATFQAVVLESKATVVVIDSAIAAFAGADLNDNSRVREMFTDAFAPLTKAGVSIILLHHKRKTQAGREEDGKASVLGAQAWGAAAGRIFTLDRLPPDCEDQAEGSFKVCLQLVGSWTPGPTNLVLKVADMTDQEHGDGIEIVVVDDDEQVRRGGVTKVQKVAIELVHMVQAEGRIGRKKAVELVREKLHVSEGTFKEGVRHARQKSWVEILPTEGAKRGEVDLVPGAKSEEVRG